MKEKIASLRKEVFEFGKTTNIGEDRPSSHKSGVGDEVEHNEEPAGVADEEATNKEFVGCVDEDAAGVVAFDHPRVVIEVDDDHDDEGDGNDVPLAEFWIAKFLCQVLVQTSHI